MLQETVIKEMMWKNVSHFKVLWRVLMPWQYWDSLFSSNNWTFPKSDFFTLFFKYFKIYIWLTHRNTKLGNMFHTSYNAYIIEYLNCVKYTYFSSFITFHGGTCDFLLAFCTIAKFLYIRLISGDTIRLPCYTQELLLSNVKHFLISVSEHWNRKIPMH